jgi:hypothetical protein
MTDDTARHNLRNVLVAVPFMLANEIKPADCSGQSGHRLIFILNPDAWLPGRYCFADTQGKADVHRYRIQGRLRRWLPLHAGIQPLDGLLPREYAKKHASQASTAYPSTIQM